MAGRQFSRPGRDQLRVTGITEHPAREGKVYCTVILDVYSRWVVGWSIDITQAARLVTSALDMAIRNRDPAAGLIIHPGSEYVGAGVLGLPDSHSDGRDRMLVPGCSRAS